MAFSKSRDILAGAVGHTSQRSLHNEPIFRLLLKVAVKGTQQCEFLNFCGTSCPNNSLLLEAPCSQYLFSMFVLHSIKPFSIFEKLMYVRRRLVVIRSFFRHRFVVGSSSVRHRLVVLSSSLCRRFVVGSASFRRPFVVLSSSRRLVPIPNRPPNARGWAAKWGGSRQAEKSKRLEVAQMALHQRSLPTTQAHFPTTEDTARFCLLCCQPEPMPMSLSTRTSQLPLRCPCRVPTWSGQAINMISRT